MFLLTWASHALSTEMEAEGLAERRPASSDRRAKIMSVTDKGRELLARSQEIVDRIHRDVPDTLPVELRYAFVADRTPMDLAIS